MAEEVVLVTGGTGLVGRAIERISDSGRRWIFVGSDDADLRSRGATEALFQKHRPTHVIHLAAMVGGLFLNMAKKVEFYHDNSLINANVMECSRIYKVTKLVSCLSTCIFPEMTTYPINETMIHDGPPHPSNQGYAYAKRMVDVMNHCYAEEYGCNFTAVIPTNIFGEHDNFSIQGGHVIPGIVHKCFLAKKHGDNFVVWGSGTPLRQFIYSHDLAKLTVWVLDNYADPDPIILSVDENAEVSIKDVAFMIADAMDFPHDRVIFDTSKSDGQYKKTASIAKLRSFLPDFQFTPMDTALRAVVNWFVENYDTARTEYKYDERLIYTAG